MPWLSCSHLWCGHWCSVVKIKQSEFHAKREWENLWGLRKLPEGLQASWVPREVHGVVNTTLISDEPLEPAPSPSLLQLLKLRRKRTKKACDTGECGNSKEWWNLCFSPSILSSKAERQKNPSAFVKTACPSHLLINQCGDPSCSFVFSRVETYPVYLEDTRIVGFN